MVDISSLNKPTKQYSEYIYLFCGCVVKLLFLTYSVFVQKFIEDYSRGTGCTVNEASGRNRPELVDYLFM